MKRLIFIDLLAWRNSPTRTPVLLRGARQVGKTHAVRQLGKTFHSFVEINFEKTPDLIKLFDHDLDPIRIIRELSILINKKIEPGKTLLFLDEIQEAPKAITALRYFYEEIPNLHVIAAGSLVDFAIEQVGIPVGRISFLYLYPMSFIEYLHAKGFQNLAIEILNHQPSNPINEAIHKKAIRLLGEYIAIGGMPQAVHQWIMHENLHFCTDVLNTIKNAYEQDFSKYAKRHQIKYVELLFKQIPGIICQHFKYSMITDYRKRELEPSLHLLEKAGIVHQIIQSHGQGIPLGAQADLGKFKLIMHDVGLNQAILGIQPKDWIVSPTTALFNQGNITESFVGQEFLAYANPTDKQKLYYWHREKRGSNAEIDYLITHAQNVIPVEVKSGHGGSLQSMRLFLQSHPHTPYGIRFSIHNYSIFDNIHSYPVYAIAATLDNRKRILKFLQTAENNVS
ncbi:MAG: AAA family ATPase [Gammaproteobacteria bacterium]